MSRPVQGDGGLTHGTRQRPPPGGVHALTPGGRATYQVPPMPATRTSTISRSPVRLWTTSSARQLDGTLKVAPCRGSACPAGIGCEESNLKPGTLRLKIPNCAQRLAIQFGHTPLCGVVLTNRLIRGFAGSGTNLALISCSTPLAGVACNPANKLPINENAAIVLSEKNSFIMS